MQEIYETLKAMSLEQLRAVIRAGQYQSHTAGLGRGYLQTNLSIMPKAYALAFHALLATQSKALPADGCV